MIVIVGRKPEIINLIDNRFLKATIKIKNRSFSSNHRGNGSSFLVFLTTFICTPHFAPCLNLHLIQRSVLEMRIYSFRILAHHVFA